MEFALNQKYKPRLSKSEMWLLIYGRGKAKSVFFYSYKYFTKNLTVYCRFLLFDTTGTIPRGAKDHDYPMASLKVQVQVQVSLF